MIWFWLFKDTSIGKIYETLKLSFEFEYSLIEWVELPIGTEGPLFQFAESIIEFAEGQIELSGPHFQFAEQIIELADAQIRFTEGKIELSGPHFQFAEPLISLWRPPSEGQQLYLWEHKKPQLSPGFWLK